MADCVSVKLPRCGEGPDDLVFTSPRGDVLRLNNWRRDVFDAAATSVGMNGLVPHALRHTAASLAISAGAHVKERAEPARPPERGVTLDVYAGLFGDNLDAVAERMESAREAAAAQTPRTERGLKVVPLEHDQRRDAV
jgi:integrase